MNALRPLRVLPVLCVLTLPVMFMTSMHAVAQTPPTGADEEQADPGGDDAAADPIAKTTTSVDDVLQQIIAASGDRVGLVEYGPISLLYPPWQDLNDKLDDAIGLRLGMSYYMLFQFTTLSPDASSGDFNFFGRWTLIKGETAQGTLGFNIRDRHAFTSIAPSQLNLAIGSIWRTTRGFNDAGFNFNELWWDQKLANDHVGFRVGTINQKHFWDLYSFKSQKRFFMSTPLSDSPTIAFPRNGFGAVLRVSPTEQLHLSAGIGDANGNRKVGGIDTFFSEREFFTALDVAYTPLIDDLGESRYSLTLWHVDARSSAGTPSGRGISALVEQEIGGGVVPFARYGYGEGATLAIEQVAALGVGFEQPFGQDDDVAGVAASWAHPQEGAGLRDQWGVEAFYRIQVTPVLDITPGFQVIVNPSSNPDRDVIGVFELRLGLVF